MDINRINSNFKYFYLLKIGSRTLIKNKNINFNLYLNF